MAASRNMVSAIVKIVCFKYFFIGISPILEHLSYVVSYAPVYSVIIAVGKTGCKGKSSFCYVKQGQNMKNVICLLERV